MAETKIYLTVPQVAERLGLHPESVRKMVREGRLPAFKAGRSWRFDPAEIEAWRKRQQPATAGRRVLVVDDAVHVRDVIRITLEELGHRVIQAETGAGAIAALRQPLPDLILLDLKLPAGSGVDVLREARTLAPDLPVVIITGFPDSELMHRALAYGPFTVLAKPVAPDVLRRTVAKALGTGASSRRTGPDPADGRSCSVLVVDDEEAVCQVLLRSTGRLGCDGRYATSGEAGLAMIAEWTPDLILLDLQMPGMTGDAFLARLRQTHPDLPVVIVTGYPNSAMMHEASHHPPVLLLAKPVEPALLERTLRSVLGDRLAPAPAAALVGAR